MLYNEILTQCCKGDEREKRKPLGNRARRGKFVSALKFCFSRSSASVVVSDRPRFIFKSDTPRTDCENISSSEWGLLSKENENL